MKNRYGDILRDYNKQILELVPYNPILFIVAAKEIQKIYKAGNKVLEIGSGEGDSARPILERTTATIELLDISEEMLDKARIALSEFKDRTEYICEDANDYLEKSESHDIIFSAWTIHNFNKDDRTAVLSSIYKNLAPGGSFIMMDKIYPEQGGMDLLEKQNKRYEQYLPQEVAQTIIAHEKEDASDKYRIDEKLFIQKLRELGFKNISIVDRVERDVVLIAQK